MPHIPNTRIEELDAKSPGLRQHVDLRLDGGAKLRDIQRELAETWGVTIHYKTLSSYKQRRWLPAKLRIRNLAELSEAVITVVNKYGLNKVAQAFVFERLLEARAKGLEPSPRDLLHDVREREKLKVQKRRVQLYAKQVEARRQQIAAQLSQLRGKQQRVEQVVAEAKEAAALGRPFDPVTVYRRISEVIGVGQSLEPRSEAPGNSLAGRPEEQRDEGTEQNEDLMRDTTDAITE